MSDPSQREPFLPKISLRLLIGAVTISAIAMGVVQQAVTAGQTWAVLASVLIAAILVPVLLYIATFSLASLFSTLGSAAVGPEKPQVIHRPTEHMPQPGITESSAIEKPGTIDRPDVPAIDNDPQDR